jgi:hypothetical protein
MQRSSYYQWEPETLEALRAELREGDSIRPMYAFSCLVIHGDGTETEFKRQPKRK